MHGSTTYEAEFIDLVKGKYGLKKNGKEDLLDPGAGQQNIRFR